MTKSKEYIDKAETLKELEIALKDIARSDREDYIIATAIQTIRDLHAAKVKPVRHGKWIKFDMHKGMEQYKCSLCQSLVYVPECIGKPMFNWCPICGAKMDGGVSDGEIN